MRKTSRDLMGKNQKNFEAKAPVISQKASGKMRHLQSLVGGLEHFSIYWE